ncbi:MAG: YhcH/YjgK/YiaL family protein [Lachnospiraceae bacterium]|nr:YhcH/YjgK/YiaL family protein [Lachnospiraceae bacterium]
MIFDKLSNIGSYKGLIKNLDTAIDYIMNHDLAALPLGRTVVDGENVYINCMEAVTGPVEDKQYEMHREYLDIQIDLEGTERVITGDQSQMNMNEYNAESDYALGESTPLADCTIGPGNFVICMVGEPHMPGVALKEPAAVKKCVFKVHK